MRSIYKSFNDLEVNKLYYLFHYLDDKPCPRINMCVRILGIDKKYVVVEKADQGSFFDREFNFPRYLTLPNREYLRKWYVT